MNKRGERVTLLFYFISISSFNWDWNWKAYIKNWVCNLVYLNENEIDCFQLVIEDTPKKKLELKGVFIYPDEYSVEALMLSSLCLVQ